MPFYPAPFNEDDILVDINENSVSDDGNLLIDE